MSDKRIMESDPAPSVGFQSSQFHLKQLQSEPVSFPLVGLESCVTTKTRKPMPYDSRFGQEQKQILQVPAQDA